MSKVDGRRVTEGAVFPWHASNAAVARQQCVLVDEKSTVHSVKGATVGISIAFCIKNDLNFKLTKDSGGYFLQLTK